MQTTAATTHLEDKCGTLGLLVTTKLKVLASLERELCLGLAVDALETEHDLLSRLGLLVEDGLGLTSVSGLLAVVTTLSLCEEGGLEVVLGVELVAKRGRHSPLVRFVDSYLASLVLSDLVLSVLLAVPALAVCAASLWDVDLWNNVSAAALAAL